MSETEDNYQGWTNYATWRVNLEIVSDYVSNTIYEDKDQRQHWLDISTSELAGELENYVDDVLDTYEDHSTEGFNPLRSYADAFTDQVEWREIAESVKLDCQEAVKFDNENTEQRSENES